MVYRKRDQNGPIGDEYVPKPVESLVNTARPNRLFTFGSVVSGGQAPKSSASGNFNGFQYDSRKRTVDEPTIDHGQREGRRRIPCCHG